MNHVSFYFLGFDRYVLLFLSGLSHSLDSMRLRVSIPTCLSGSVRMVGWSCRCRGCYYGFDVVCMCMYVVKHECSLWYFFYKFVCVMACVNVLVGCMVVDWLCDLVCVWFHFVCLYAGIKLMLAGLGCGVLGYNVSVVEKVVDFFFFSCMILF